MVWKELLLGFTIAGFITVFVPQSFWKTLFRVGGGGDSADPDFLIVLENALVVPVVAFFTFIGSMGMCPSPPCCGRKIRAWAGSWPFWGGSGGGDSSLGPANITAGATPFTCRACSICMVAAGIAVHYLFRFAGLMPHSRPAVRDMVSFATDYTFYLNLFFCAVVLALVWLYAKTRGSAHVSS